MAAGENNGRRSFLFKGTIIALAGITGSFVGFSACKGKDEEDISPPEDLMREHGLLNRVLLIYDHYITLLSGKESIQTELLQGSATIIKDFIENYHEKQEEDFLFPRFEKANQHTELVKVLRQQHAGGRRLTEGILNMGGRPGITTESDKQQLSALLLSFVRMYRPHEAREDTVLFPAIRSIVSGHEFDALGEDFEKREHQLFGKGGFELYVDKVAAIEKQLGIYELAGFTP